MGSAPGVLVAGGIGRIRGLPGIRVGDRLGAAVRADPAAPQFSPPGLEALVRPRHPGQAARLHAALVALADEDPLIATRALPGGETAVLLYGAVQREVLAARLDREFAVAAEFGEIRPVYFERLAGTGEAVVELDPRRPNDFWATVGLRVEPGPPGSGPRLLREVEWGALPRAFHRAIEDAALRALDQGLCGWPVLDCTVTVIRAGYQAPISAAADYRGLTPVVLLRALRAAGTRVHEPCQAFEIELPPEAVSPVVGRIAGLGGEISASAARGSSWSVAGRLPARRVHELTAALPGLTHGEAAMWTSPGPDRPLRGKPPLRPRLDGNPLNYAEYLRFLQSRLPR